MNKYKDALTYLRNSVVVTDHKQKERVNECTDVLQGFIEEHFDNPPLKFEELEIGQPYWDNKDKLWCIYADYHVFDYIDGFGSEFEENRFYRKQVEE